MATIETKKTMTNTKTILCEQVKGNLFIPKEDVERAIRYVSKFLNVNLNQARLMVKEAMEEDVESASPLVYKFALRCLHIAYSHGQFDITVRLGIDTAAL